MQVWILIFNMLHALSGAFPDDIQFYGSGIKLSKQDSLQVRLIRGRYEKDDPYLWLEHLRSMVREKSSGSRNHAMISIPTALAVGAGVAIIKGIFSSLSPEQEFWSLQDRSPYYREDDHLKVLESPVISRLVRSALYIVLKNPMTLEDLKARYRLNGVKVFYYTYSEYQPFVAYPENKGEMLPAGKILRVVFPSILSLNAFLAQMPPADIEPLMSPQERGKWLMVSGEKETFLVQAAAASDYFIYKERDQGGNKTTVHIYWFNGVNSKYLSYVDEGRSIGQPRREIKTDTLEKGISLFNAGIKAFKEKYPQVSIVQVDGAMKTVDAASIVSRDYGGIDLSTSSGMQWTDTKVGDGVEMNVDPAMMARFRSEGISSLSAVVLKITPITSIWQFVGLRH